MSVDAVVAGAVEQRRVEEGGVALGERQLHQVLVEVRDELRPAPGQVAGLVLVRVREVHGRAALDRHVGVRDRALQGEHGREPVHVGREARCLLVGHEAEVVVAVRALRGPAGVDHVDLAGDLVARAEPRLGHQRQHLVGVVVGEHPGLAHRQLLQRVPHPVVGARLGEVVAGRGAAGSLLGDHLVEGLGGAVDDRGVGVRTGEDHQARPVGQRAHQLGLHLAAPVVVGRGGRGAGRRRTPARPARRGRRAGSRPGRSAARRSRRSRRDGSRRRRSRRPATVGVRWMRWSSPQATPRDWRACWTGVAMLPDRYHRCPDAAHGNGHETTRSGVD